MEPLLDVVEIADVAPPNREALLPVAAADVGSLPPAPKIDGWALLPPKASPDPPNMEPVEFVVTAGAPNSPPLGAAAPPNMEPVVAVAGAAAALNSPPLTLGVAAPPKIEAAAVVVGPEGAPKTPPLVLDAVLPPNIEPATGALAAAAGVLNNPPVPLDTAAPPNIEPDVVGAAVAALPNNPPPLLGAVPPNIVLLVGLAASPAAAATEVVVAELAEAVDTADVLLPPNIPLAVAVTAPKPNGFFPPNVALSKEDPPAVPAPANSDVAFLVTAVAFVVTAVAFVVTAVAFVVTAVAFVVAVVAVVDTAGLAGLLKENPPLVAAGVTVLPNTPVPVPAGLAPPNMLEPPDAPLKKPAAGTPELIAVLAFVSA
jgi:hypothetical protein